MSERTTEDPGSAEEVSHPVFAAFWDATLPLGERYLRPHREYLAEDLSGRVLDLGAGSGAMFSYLAAAADAADGDLEVHAVEPDPHMRKRAVERAGEAEVDVVLRDGRAESVPYPDGTFDAVISAVVFCSVADPDAAVDEVARVLKPGGEFRFLEHVGADGWRRSAQETLNPLWNRLGGGCNLNRDTVEGFVGHDAFEVIDVERLDVGTFPASPVVRGRLRRRKAAPLGG